MKHWTWLTARANPSGSELTRPLISFSQFQKSFISYLLKQLSSFLTAVEHIHHPEDIKVVVRQRRTSFVVVTVLVQTCRRHSKPEISHSIRRVEVECVELENSKLNFLAIKLHNLYGNWFFQLLHIRPIEEVSSTSGNCECFQQSSALELSLGDCFAEFILNELVWEVE